MYGVYKDLDYSEAPPVDVPAPPAYQLVLTFQICLMTSLFLTCCHWPVLMVDARGCTADTTVWTKCPFSVYADGKKS